MRYRVQNVQSGTQMAVSGVHFVLYTAIFAHGSPGVHFMLFTALFVHDNLGRTFCAVHGNFGTLHIIIEGTKVT